jgi:ATP-binding cassette, subfamily G (WHITE), member 2, PDR
MANEFSNQNVPCAALIPPYPNVGIQNQVCLVTGNYISMKVLILGAIPGQTTVSGARWLELSYGYSANHIWRNLGIIIAFFIFFTATFLIAIEYKSPPDSRGEVLVFPLGKEPEHEQGPAVVDQETGPNESSGVENVVATRTITGGNVEAMKKDLHAPQDIFTWRNVCCDVRIKTETRRLLSNVSGYVKPGTLTALMGESGAGKTTLLDT